MRVPRCDVDASVKFSWYRCLFAISGFLLVLSDVPRSGFGSRDLSKEFPQVAPGAFMYFGPYAYSGACIVRSEADATAFNGTCGSDVITETSVWAYKYDSLSVAFRAIAKEFRVHEFPRCLMYLEECPSQSLSLQVAFTMLDALVDALQANYFQQYGEASGHQTPPLVFVTRHNWVDRLHHYILSKFLWRRVDTRLNAVHYYRSRGGQEALSLCNPLTPRAYRPAFCEQRIAWEVDAADSSTAVPKTIRAAKHIAERFAELETQHPHLEFDLTVITSVQAVSNIQRLRQLPIAYFKSESSEITTLIRGRLCDDARDHSGRKRCETRLVDDFRYERAVLFTNVEDWYTIVRFLRGAAQLYMWIRVLLLWLGCYLARRHEPKFVAAGWLKRLRWTMTTIFKIPSHIIVYGSWIPIVLYVLAYFVDSGTVHLLAEEVWSSVNGAIHFNFLDYMTAASVQMRNTWLIGLAVKSLVVFEVHCMPPRRSPWMLRHGLISVRGGLIGLLATTTIFSYLRSTSFRDTNLLVVRRLPSETVREKRWNAQQLETGSDFGFYFDLRVIIFSVVCVVCATFIVKFYLWWPRWWRQRRVEPKLISAITEIGFTTKVVFSRFRCLPYSVGTLAPLAALGTYWLITLRECDVAEHSATRKKPWRVGCHRGVRVGDADGEDASEGAARHHFAPIHESLMLQGPVCQVCLGRQTSPLVAREPERLTSILRIEKRSGKVWSAVQLINIALLTDPLTLFGLFVVGRELFIYRVNAQRPDDESELEDDLVLLPCDPMTLLQNTTGLVDPPHEPSRVYELVDTVDSRTVPWRLLVLCG